MIKCKCGKPANWEWVNGELIKICDACLEEMDVLFCDQCQEYHNEEYVEYVESHNQWMCETCRGDL